MMKFTVDNTQVKRLLKIVMIELMNEQQDLFIEIISEALAETGLAEAIHDNRKDEFVSEDEIITILQG